MERKQLPRALVLAGLGLVAAAAMLPIFDEASAAPRIRGSGSGFHSVSRGDSFRRWHGPRRHHGFVRGWGGVYLDRGWDNGGVNVSIQQNIAPGSGGYGYAPFSVPSVSELPAVAGIREVRPSQPAIYVVNDGRGGVPATSGLRRPSVASHDSGPYRPSGPRILEVTPDGDWVATTGSIGQSEQGSGPRIIHLDVPVGSNR